MDETTLKYIELFRGNGSCYGSWEGGCVREPLTPGVMEAHLELGPHIGVYGSLPRGDDTMCVWGCTDIDYTDDPANAFKLQQVFAKIGVPAWVERSAHGFHIWVFCKELVSAGAMRRMFLAAHQVADEPPKEVNPKQESLGFGQVGNYVRLPYPGVAYGPPANRFIIDNQNVMMGFEEFVNTAHATRINAETVERYAAYYIPPPAISYEVGIPTEDMAIAAQMLTPLGRVIHRDGPLEGNDRSRTMQHLAHECRKAGLAPGDAEMLLKDCDQRWGRLKYSSRVDGGAKDFADMIRRAYGTP